MERISGKGDLGAPRSSMIDIGVINPETCTDIQGLAVGGSYLFGSDMDDVWIGQMTYE